MYWNKIQSLATTILYGVTRKFIFDQGQDEFMLGQQYQFDSYRLISQTLLSDIRGRPGAHAVFAILDFLRRPRSQNGSVFQEPRCVGRPEEVRFEEHSICFQKLVFGSGNALEPQFGVGNRRHWLLFCWLHIETSFSYRKGFPFRAKFPDSTILLVIGNSSKPWVACWR